VFIDVSSLTRAHIARFAYDAFALSRRTSKKVVVDFVYSPAEFSPPPNDFGPISFRGPVIPELCGWNPDPEVSSALIVGIGYEPDLALGLSEEIEPEDVFAFRPAGHDPRYTSAIDRQNHDFLQKLPSERKLEYDVFDPYALYVKLINVVVGFKQKRRTTIVPLGPKIFSLCSVLCGLECLPALAVWRVTAAEFGEPVNRLANGRLDFLRVEFVETGAYKAPASGIADASRPASSASRTTRHN
jgi:hypothetical protein